MKDFIDAVINKLIDSNIRYIVDWSDASPGYKFNDWEMKGVPIRMEIGPRDVESNKVVLVRRDIGKKEFLLKDELFLNIDNMLKEIQNSFLFW